MNRYVCIKSYLYILPEISPHHFQLKYIGGLLPYSLIHITFIVYIHMCMHAIYVLLSDINECANDSTDSSAVGLTEGAQNGCSQICRNTNGSLYCECFSGYQLSDDLMTCVGM